MPTSIHFNLPKFKNDGEFEELVRDVLSRKWNSDLMLHGRSGQRQHGVDIYGERHRIPGAHVGVQCKNVDVLNLKAIEAELTSAESFEPKLVEYWIATTLDRDAALQGEVWRLSAERKKQGLLGVGIFFWQDIKGELSGHPDLLKKYYPSLSLSADDDRSVEQRSLELVRKAYVKAREDSGSSSVMVGCMLALNDELDIKAAYSLKGSPMVRGVVVDEPRRCATVYVNRSNLPDELLLPRGPSGGWLY